MSLFQGILRRRHPASKAAYRLPHKRQHSGGHPAQQDWRLLGCTSCAAECWNRAGQLPNGAQETLVMDGLRLRGVLRLQAGDREG